MGDTRLRWPVPGYTGISCRFGPRRAPVSGASRFHGGIDIRCRQGSLVYAPFGGRVTRVWLDAVHGGGLSVRINCSDVQVGLCHLSRTHVSEGQAVTPGQLVASSGGTPGTYGAGRSTGPHLHLAVRQGGRLVDPLTVPWVPPVIEEAAP